MSDLIKSSLLLMFLVTFGCSQKTSKPSAFNQLIEEGYEVLLSDTLKTAQKEFIIVALKDVAEDSLMFASNTTIQRPLLILEKRGAAFDIALRNDNVILCANCGGVMGNPFEGIEISDKMIVINHSGGSRYRWTRNVGFSYDAKEEMWLLSSDQGVSFDSMNPDEEFEEVMYTMIDSEKRVLFEDFNIYQD